ncbi:MAG: AbrB/MazE/SpoVT family DNA-binding domain-containing protein [Succinivibrionaceae bacterium]|nr:AbrB/MazE/SpoVT family DNA-binding domain-containing protein [Succinivibrionaceae bacterium]
MMITSHTTAIKAWGNSQGLRIPRSILDTLGWEPGSQVELHASGGVLTVKRIAPPLPGSLEECFAHYKGQRDPQGEIRL